jgi:hypothetical protein
MIHLRYQVIAIVDNDVTNDLDRRIDINKIGILA